jgi:hypothetical protein
MKVLRKIYFVFVIFPTAGNFYVCSLSGDGVTLINQLRIAGFLSGTEGGALVIPTVSP